MANNKKGAPTRAPLNRSAVNHLPVLCLCGFKLGVFPGVSLLSRRRLSGSPVDGAIGFGPGLIDIT
jgi:hypothetical protein